MAIEIVKTDEGENSCYLFLLDGVHYEQKGAKSEDQARFFASKKINELKTFVK